jgi:hypothetical protein
MSLGVAAARSKTLPEFKTVLISQHTRSNRILRIFYLNCKIANKLIVYKYIQNRADKDEMVPIILFFRQRNAYNYVRTFESSFFLTCFVDTIVCINNKECIS